jgi:hypothetical protein
MRASAPPRNEVVEEPLGVVPDRLQAFLAHAIETSVGKGEAPVAAQFVAVLEQEVPV